MAENCRWCGYRMDGAGELCAYCRFHDRTVAMAERRDEWRRQQTDLAFDGGLQGEALWAAYWGWDKEHAMRRTIATTPYDPPIPDDWKARATELMLLFPDDLADECWCHPDVDYPLAGGVGTLVSDGFGLRFVQGRLWSGTFVEMVPPKEVIAEYARKVRYALDNFVGQDLPDTVESAHQDGEFVNHDRQSAWPSGDLRDQER